MSQYIFKSEDIATGAPGYIAPLSVDFSPDGKLLTYLYPDASGPRKVFAMDLAEPVSDGSYKLFDTAASGGLSLQEQLRRERMRLFTQGIASYEWNGKNCPTQKMIVPLDGKVILYEEGLAGKCRVVYDAAAGDAVDPHMSPDGTAIAFVINDDLYAMPIPAVDETSSPAPVRLTVNGAKKGVTCGLADYVAQEEMDRYRGFWWAPDSRSIVYAEADETMVPEFCIQHPGKDDPTHAETHRYPFAGKVNPEVTLAVVKVDFSGPVVDAKDHVWLDLVDRKHPDFTTVADLGADAIASYTAGSPQDTMDFYIARVGWWADGAVMVQIENRAQSVLQLLRVDASTGMRTVILEERSDIWINLYHMLHCFDPAWRLPADTRARKDDFCFLWASERSGFAQLYLYRYDAAAGTGVCLSGPIGGGGEFVVESIDAVDESSNMVYFSGNKGNACERHLYCASVVPDCGEIHQLTTEPGFHSAAVNLKRGVVADVFSSTTCPLRMTLYTLDAAACALSATLGVVTDSANDDARLSRAHYRESLATPQFHTIRSADDKVDLHCALYLPAGVTFDPATGIQSSAPCAAIMSVYGGPHVQRVQNSWALTADLRAQCLAQQGFVVIKCDNRGAFRRGIAFEGAIHRDMGNLEVQDQTCAATYFAQKGLIDSTRVGMFGWSYGGYMSAMSVCRSPAGTFACSVAGAPVTSWDGYDTHYTERYMGTPQNNPAGYASSSVMTHVPSMSGHLMLVHGLIDENVHFRHTARLINTLISARKRYELVLFPCERHSPHKLQDKIYIEDIMHEFFVRHLRPVAPSSFATLDAAAVAATATALAAVSASPKMMASL